MRKLIILLLLVIIVAESAHAQAGMPTPPYTTQSLANLCGLPPTCTSMLNSGVYSSVKATQSLLLSSETVAGAGTTVSDAAQLSATKIVHQITGANGTLGWKMSASMPTGSVQILLNTTAGVAKIYAESGGTVNGGSVDAAFSALTGVKPIICVKTASLTYLCS